MAEELFNIISPEGEISHGPADYAKWALENGYRIADEKDIQSWSEKEAERQRIESIKQSADSPAGVIAASAGSAADALTLGGFSAVLDKVAPETAEKLKLAQEENPMASNVGGLGGLVAGPALARGALNTVAGAGKVVGQAVESVAGKTLGTVARYGTEGAAAALPTAIPEAILGEPEDAAEALIAGGVIGATAGTALHVGGSFVSMAIGNGQQALASARQRVSEVAQRIGGGIEAVGEGISKKTGMAVERFGSAVEGSAPTVGEMAEGLAPKVDELLSDAEYNQIEKMFGIGKALRKKLNKNDAQFSKKFVDFAKEKGLVKLDFDPHTALIDTEQAIKAAGEEIGKIFKTVDDAGVRFLNSDDLRAKLIQIGNEVPDVSLMSGERRAYDNAMEVILPRLENKKGELRFPKMQELQSAKNILKQYGANDRFDTKPGKDIVMRMWRAIDDEMGNFLDLTEAQFPDQLASWKAAKRDYFFYKRMEEVLQDTTAQSGNQLVSLSDMLFSLGGIGVGGIVGGAGGFVANSLRQRYGAQAAALSLQGARKALMSADGLIGESVDAFLKRTGERIQGVGQSIQSAATKRKQSNIKNIASQMGLDAKNPREAAIAIADRLAFMASNTAATVSRLQALTSDVSTMHPELGAAMTGKVSQAIDYLAREAPKPARPATPFDPDTYALSERDIFVFERKLNAALDPYTVLDDMRRGLLDPDALNTVRALYPKLYQRITSTLLDKATQKKRNYTAQQKTQLSMLLGAQIDALHAPDRLTMLQESYLRPDSHLTPGQQSRAARKSPSLALGEPTEIGRITSR